MPVRPVSSRDVRVLYQDMLARPPFRDERKHWMGKPFDDLVAHLISGVDVWDAWLEEQYYYFLLVDNFRPLSERVLALPQDLAAGRIGVREALHRVALCASFDRRNPGADTFVTVVMEQLLGITVQKEKRQLAAGRNLYDGVSDQFLGEQGNSQSDVVRIAIEDKRALTHFVEREYRRLLKAEPERRDVVEWAGALQTDPKSFGSLLKGWLNSEHYGVRLETRFPVSNRLFVRSLFVDLAGRLPEDEESERMRNALDGLADPGPLRSILARLMLDSGKTQIPKRGELGDEAQWIRGLFERLLGRSAESAELAVFVSALDDPACRPETVVYAIVSHPEYPTH
ncbi:MAG: hypothetical protein ACI8QS_000798 [Planctomycetota bacterium]|jgi:hypothetical protein